VNGTSIFTRATTADVMRAAGLPVPSNPAKLVTCPLPDHDDSSPSFRVFERGFTCFGCGARGGVADLAIALGLAHDRRDAARWLEGRMQ